MAVRAVRAVGKRAVRAVREPYLLAHDLAEEVRGASGDGEHVELPRGRGDVAAVTREREARERGAAESV